MDTQTVNETPQIERFLTMRGWEKASNYGNLEFTNLDQNSRVYINRDGEWRAWVMEGGALLIEIGKGATAEELKRTLADCDMLPWECPYCGESGGTPRTSYSRPYLYGADADGNRGEMRQDEEEGCSLCIKSGGPDYD